MDDCCKVGETADKYDLKHSVAGGDLNDYLLARWKGKNEYPETGLRPLADWFNQKIMKTVYSEYDRGALETRLESDYNALTSDHEEHQIDILQDLDADGIDGEELRGDFISSTTLYRHFKNCLNEEKSKQETDKKAAAENAMDRVNYSRNSVKNHVQKSLTTLEERGIIPHATEADITIPVILSCPVCTTQVQLEHAVDQGYVCEDHMTESADVVAELTDSSTSESDEDTTADPLDNFA